MPLSLSLHQVLQCYAQRMERVRQSKLKLAKAIGTAGYYHTTVIDMRGLNAAFLKHRGIIQRASMRKRPSWGVGGRCVGCVGRTSPSPPEGRHWLWMALHTPGASQSGFGPLPEEAGMRAQGQANGLQLRSFPPGGPFASRRRATPRPSSESTSLTAPRRSRWLQMAPAFRVHSTPSPRTASLRARGGGARSPPRSAASAAWEPQEAPCSQPVSAPSR